MSTHTSHDPKISHSICDVPVMKSLLTYHCMDSPPSSRQLVLMGDIEYALEQQQSNENIWNYGSRNNLFN
jgi:hypothetical protein